MFAQQREVQGFFARHTQPVAVVLQRHAGETPDGVEREVDRVELDVRDSVQQRRAAFERGRGAARHVFRRDEAGQGGTAGEHSGHVEAVVGVDRRGVEIREQRACLRRFRARVGEAQGREGESTRVHL